MSTDRLSALPDPLLIHILSFLGVKRAAVISVLSKRWQYLWTDLPCLRFEDSRIASEKTRKLVSWINRTLVLRSVNYLEKFVIFLDYDECFESDVNSWVEFSVRNMVKNLSLFLYSINDLYRLPQAIYSASSLTQLSMYGCIVSPRRTIEWKSLTELLIYSVQLDENVIEKILAGCPVLHHFDLSECWGFKRLEVNSPSLYSLEILNYEAENGEALLEISAPYIHCLNVRVWPLGTRKLRLTNVRSLVRAHLFFEEPDTSVEAIIDTIKLLEDLEHVKELQLECWCIEVISKMVVDGWQLPQSTRTCLTIDTFRHEDYIFGILGLLKSSPNLETLVISCSDWYDNEDNGRTWDAAAKADLDCELLQLKTVNLTRYAGPVVGGEPMLTMARILLKRAPALEKMVIDVEEYTKFSSSSDFIKMIETVRSYPKSSKKAVIVFHQ